MQLSIGKLVTATLAAGLLLPGQAALADSVQDLAAAAAGKGPVIWYESSPPEPMLKLAEAFNARYPNIKIQYVRITGGGGIAARVIQEAGAGAATASFTISDVQQVIPLQARGMLVGRDWKPLGVDPALVRTPYAVSATAALGLLVWNKTRVKASDLPTTWDGLIDARWSGRIGTWVRAPTLATLAKASGEEHMRDYVRKLIALKPMIYPSTYQLAQQVGAGEVDVGIGLYHSALPVIKSGAPIEITFLDPTPVNMLYGAVINKGGNPEGAQVLLAWLSSTEGAKAYEAFVGRGNPLVAGTETAGRVSGRKLVEYAFDESSTLERLDEEFTRMLKGAGQTR